jgi:hypothetical protein
MGVYPIAFGAGADSTGVGDVMLSQEMPRTLGLILYREYQEGASIDELSSALSLPPVWVEERIEAARLCMEMQVRVECVPTPTPRARRARRRRPAINIESAKKRRSR